MSQEGELGMETNEEAYKPRGKLFWRENPIGSKSFLAAKTSKLASSDRGGRLSPTNSAV